ncbi:divergent PAP2 family protein [Fournierella massiliensis]|nr:divergent PAP2 family protein [Fournierella massiliensis]MCF2556274.1 divergent PAP2 family protein [Fournierella massiliensis]
MEVFESIFSWNYILSVSITGWCVAQVLKTLIDVILIGRFDPERLWGAGGMPSSHSSTVCAMTVACGRYVGVHSPVFAVAAVLAIIVMYDAMGVRRETGEQAKVLNRLLTTWMESGAENMPFLADKKLKEMVGHTPFEVLSGAVLGTVIGFAVPIV